VKRFFFKLVFEALATCHTVKQLGSTGALVGNQVECAMVRTVGWSLGNKEQLLVMNSNKLLDVMFCVFPERR